jgi:hypothetical protein
LRRECDPQSDIGPATKIVGIFIKNNPKLPLIGGHHDQPILQSVPKLVQPLTHFHCSLVLITNSR